MLFFGNSVTYVGNLPAVFAALCSASDIRCTTEMIVQGGATLADRVADRSLDRASGDGRFDYLILQERGGDLIGAAMQAGTREQAETAALTLTRLARDHKMTPVLLGTYQGTPSASSALVAAEQALATRLDAAYVPVSSYLACGRRENSSLRWFDRDGMHPGSELTLMMGVLLYRELFGSFPPAVQLIVRAPIYGVSSGLSADSFAGTQPIRAETQSLITYDAATVQAVIDLARAGCE